MAFSLDDIDGLAVYDSGGDGAPLLLMPYTHVYMQGPIAESELAETLVGMGRRVITFDPPGAWRSARAPSMSLLEMLECAEEALALRGIFTRVDVLGHSAGAYCAFVYAHELPERVRWLVLECPAWPGGPFRYFRTPWKPWEPDFWRFWALAPTVGRGKASLAQFTEAYRLMASTYCLDRLRTPAVLAPPEGAARVPAPLRAEAVHGLVSIDATYASAVTAPSLVIASAHDPHVRLSRSRAIARAMPGASLTVFEHSAHCPHVEEPERFREVVGAFLRDESRGVATA